MPSRVVPHHKESRNRTHQQHLRSKVKNVYHHFQFNFVQISLVSEITGDFISNDIGTSLVWPQQLCHLFNWAAPVAERLRALFLNHSIISPLCLVRVRAPLWPHVRQAKFCLRVCQVVFLGVLPFSPHLLIGPSHIS